MSGLLSLANELLHSIADQLSLSEVKNFRLVCTTASQALEESMHSRSKLSINVHRQTLDMEMDKVVALSTGAFPRPEVVRHLRIGHLAPDYDPNDSRTSVTDGWGGYLRPQKFKQPIAVMQAMSDLQKHLAGALRSLVGLKSLEWILSADDLEREWAYETVLSSVANCSNLHEINIDAYFVVDKVYSILPLDKLPAMRKITARAHGKDTWQTFFKPLSKCISRSSELETLSLNSGRLKDELPVFNDLIKDCLHTLPLADLSLTGWKVETTPALISHLRNVKTIQPCTWNTCVFDSSFLVSLSREGVCLLEIDTGTITAQMLQYIGSYRGIKILHMSMSSDGPDLYRKFYEEVLPLQRPSLEVLSIKPYGAEGFWYVDEHKGNILASCSNLKEITLAINSRRHLPWGENGEVSLYFSSIVRSFGSLCYTSPHAHNVFQKTLLDAFAFHPSIRNISLFPAGYSGSRNSFVGYSVMHNSGWTDQITKKCLTRMEEDVIVVSGAFCADFCLTIAGRAYQIRPGESGRELEWILIQENQYCPMMFW